MSAAVRPFRQFVVKVHSRCNLACTYCYVYRHADQGWRAQPTVMSPGTIDALAGRIGAHVRTHNLPRVAVVLHGGEPLLAGPDVLEHLVGAVRAAVPSGAAVDVTVQTNATLLDDAFLDLCRRHRIGIGVSVDGGPVHDRHRRHADGRPSFPAVAAALARLAQPQHRAVYAGLLCTVDLANDPVRVYEELLRFAPPQLDLLLPHGNWRTPPPGLVPGSAATPYAHWLIAVFDRWYAAPRRETGIRLFESLISLLLGGPSHSEVLGGAPPDQVTVETDGSLQGTDALKTTAPGLAATGLTVHRHSFDEAAGHPVLLAQRRGPDAVPACRRCPALAVCGGGLLAHRYAGDGDDAGDDDCDRGGYAGEGGHAGGDRPLAPGFDNRSVYCADLYRLIRHVRGRIAADLALAAHG